MLMSTNSWQPNPTWWDIETVLAQDTRDYKYKSIYLLNDALPVVHFNGAVAYATSDGKFYTESGCEHVWDVSQDKHCLIDGEVAYSTRYVITYSNTPTQYLALGIGVQPINNIIGCIADGISPLAIFAGQQALEFLKIKPYLTKITATAFANCYNLQSVELPEGLERIESGVFNGCRNLRRIEFPATLTFLGKEAFVNCESLESITLPEGIKALYDATFLCCSQLVSISMPKVESVGDGVFSGCKSLRTIYLPNVKTIGASVFTDCHSLCSLVLGNNPVTIATNSENTCYSLRSLVLPADVTFKQYAFSQLPQLNHVTFKGNCSITGIGFYGTPSLSRITLPQDFDSSVNFSHATLAPEMMVEMFGQLKDHSPKTLTLGPANLAKLTDEQKAIATDKNWILA